MPRSREPPILIGTPSLFTGREPDTVCEQIWGLECVREYVKEEFSGSSPRGKEIPIKKSHKDC